MVQKTSSTTARGQGAQACPVCGHPMNEHTIDRSTANTVLNCPVPYVGAWDRDAFEKVNEFGMSVRAHPPHKHV